MTGTRSSGDGSDAARPDRFTLVAFLLWAVLGGANVVAIRPSNSGLPPFWGATLRFGTAAVVFWIIVLLRGISLPTGRGLLGADLPGGAWRSFVLKRSSNGCQSRSSPNAHRTLSKRCLWHNC